MYTKKLSDELSKNSNLSYVFVGKKAYQTLKRKYETSIVKFFTDIANPSIKFELSSSVRDLVLELFLSNKIDECHLIYTEFKSAITQNVKSHKLLPIENSSESQAEAVKSTGANWFQWINYAIQPQVMPRMIGLSVYRLDINFRESAVVGIVGGGGIGATLNTAFSRYEFDTAAAILLIIILIVMVLEYASSFLRKWVQ